MKGSFEVTWPGLVAIIGVSVYVGWIGSAGYFKIADHWASSNTLEHVQSVEIPKLKSYARCQKAKADAAETEAVKSIVGIEPNLSEIPDCPPPPKTTPPVPKR